MDSKVKPDNYALGRSERETRRLILQHQIYLPIMFGAWSRTG